MKNAIWIPGNVASSKNGKTWTGKFLVDSKQTQAYKKASIQAYKDNKEAFLKLLEGKEKPYRIQFTFIRKSRHKFDYINPCQTVQDFMVTHGWLEDDNMDEMIPVFQPSRYDKENPGVFIEVL